ncbi:hypothetical protein D9758_017372 [Tetrapyrgos nigripes]|uniref:Mannose-P-dolichol utilization defect 1 protein homolog n=1 Tax=Tetrapyrgos nigripes TaxID=182062 RepID=A0A8H5C033_9AGAR|nr:hypothetical protein D9758_017372 [Tetrapyrgos nigripes]
MSFLTRNLPWFIHDPGVYIIGQECYTSLVENLDIFDTHCLKYAFSKALGIAIVAGGSVMKLPQILLIVRARSARGISLPSYALETIAYAIQLAYASRNAFPFSTYGENLFLTIQNIIITHLIILYAPPTLDLASSLSPTAFIERFNPRQSQHHRHPHPIRTPTRLSLTSRTHLPSKRSNLLLCTSLTLLALLFLFTPFLTPLPLLSLLQLSTLPLSLLSKYPQIRQNYISKSTGQLSVIAVASQILGCLARLYTTTVELGWEWEGWLVGLGFGMALFLNSVLGVQLVLYWGKDVVERERLRRDIMMESGGVLSPVVEEGEMDEEGRLGMRGL